MNLVEDEHTQNETADKTVPLDDLARDDTLLGIQETGRIREQKKTIIKRQAETLTSWARR